MMYAKTGDEFSCSYKYTTYGFSLLYLEKNQQAADKIQKIYLQLD